MVKDSDLWVAALTRGHNGGVCLLKNGEIVFAIEEERLSRHKYDGGPLASLVKILDYTDRLDYLVIAHTHSLYSPDTPKVDFTGDDIYTGLARKLGLISRDTSLLPNHPQVLDSSQYHHNLHAACAFYRSGFNDAVALIVDGAGTISHFQADGVEYGGWETESMFCCEYPNTIKCIYKHIGSRGPHRADCILDESDKNNKYPVYVTDRGGIVKVYEAVTQYCGFDAIEAGKTMGLFPYGKKNPNIPPLFDDSLDIPLSNRNIIIPTYPNGADINDKLNSELSFSTDKELSKLNNRRDLAYHCQIETQEQVLKLIKKAVKMSGNKNVVLSGGYGLNCVANYYYLNEIKDLDINLYVEPISSDAGTAIGAALWANNIMSNNPSRYKKQTNLYLGLDHFYTNEKITNIVEKLEVDVTEISKKQVIDIILDKNIVAIFQGKSENGPRALGNRSLLFDPRHKDGKDFVNRVKHREYFRPFAGTILQEDVHDWFDLRGMADSPSMMYAVNCKPGVAEKIPSIIHVDGTCRIQTVTKEQNLHFYELIELFKEKTGTPILFNTSFNLGGQPLVETLEDAIWTLKQSELEYLYMPEFNYLITCPNT